MADSEKRWLLMGWYLGEVEMTECLPKRKCTSSHGNDTFDQAFTLIIEPKWCVPSTAHFAMSLWALTQFSHEIWWPCGMGYIPLCSLPKLDLMQSQSLSHHPTQSLMCLAMPAPTERFCEAVSKLVFEGPVDWTRKKTRTEPDWTAVRSFLRLQLPSFWYKVSCSLTYCIFILNWQKSVQTGCNRNQSVYAWYHNKY